MDIIEKRKEELLKKFGNINQIPKKIIYLAVLIIAWFGYYIRTQNLSLLVDQVTGKYIPLALDPHIFLRNVKYLLENGHMMVNDILRYYPLGWTNASEFKVISYFIVYLYKTLHLFSSTLTIEKVHVLYPPICFFIGIIFFFLFVKKLFNWKIGLLATATLTVIPPYLYRTMAGFSDKEAFAMMTMFLALYLIVLSWKEKKVGKAVLYGTLAGISTGILGTSWGGTQFIYLTIASFTILGTIFGIFKKKDLYTYTAWLFFTFLFLILLYPERFTIPYLFMVLSTGVLVLGFLTMLIDQLVIKKNLLKIKEKIKLPDGLTSFLIVIITALIILLIVFGPQYVLDRLTEIYRGITNPFGLNRWQLTVAEAHQPYLTDWISQLSWKFIFGFLIGSVLLFYNLLKPYPSKVRYYLTGLFTIFILIFTMNRYSPTSLFNGETTLSLTIYLISILVFLGTIFYLYIKSFLKNQEEYKKIKKNLLFTLLFFLILTLGAKSAIRLLFLYCPIISLIFAYGVIALFKKIKQINQDTYKIISYLVIIFITILILFNFTQIVLQQGKYTGPSYNVQWQNGMTWVRENTPEDAVFAHWWDYGYWVQTGGERATLSDGGNARGAINHFIGRHILTATSETEALELLKANNATHLLMISDEIGKYPAFSSIGADANYDRYSWIPTFQMNTQQTQETRDETIFVYTGGTAIDHDFVYNDIVFPGGSAGIAGFLVPTTNIATQEGNETINQLKIKQPTALLAYNGRQERVPLECIYVNGQKMEFEQKGLPGCLMFIPSVNGNQQNNLGAALYISPTVKEGLFAKMYLFEEKFEHFKKVYDDTNTVAPLAYYNGRIIGPLKIWEISYPDNLQIPPEYYGTELPDPNVDKIKR